ncbi:hypothetical protein CMO90_03735 [Candidatus Woesearchaeota archaeon]|jgi:putative oxidoreductase|nr:hypothetical protein [Candidatus Woesearchaeota archaeon]|tara:strand:+ start:234 stop:644 length:411 start_codon:yes stop_codon:yes gene_type:complete
MCWKWFEKNKDLASLPLRIVLAAVFIVHGHAKLFGGLEGTASFFSSIGLPLAGILAFIVAVGEFFGGIALLIGFLTRYFATFLSIVTIFAILLVHLSGGYELALLALGGSISLIFLGAGRLSIDEKCTNWCKKKKK